MHARYCRSLAHETRLYDEVPQKHEGHRNDPIETDAAADIKHVHTREAPTDEADIGPSKDY